MDFKDVIKQLAERVIKMKDSILTEEATKTAFVLPFINALGYDVFNPMEVLPEFICDIGTKKGEKIDYAIIKDDEPIILIECKHCGQDLNLHDNQLLRYFHVSKAKFGILTNGIVYKFYTDLEKENIMDKKPFFEFNFLDIKDEHIEEIRKFHKSYFDLNNIINTASELKYTNELKQLLRTEFETPSVDFVKYFAKQVYDGMITPKVFEQFDLLLKSAMRQWKNDIVNDRFKAALSNNQKQQKVEDEQLQEENPDNPLIVTTEEELQGFYIVRSILYGEIDDIERIQHRDTQSYFGILLDDNNRKPICRLHLNGNRKYIETFDENKKGTKSLIERIDDIYEFSDLIKSTLSNYIK
ncbi:MAG: type I restriction enzyme HsdR N-terminal domain-containing protein [Tannerellaceae bacterium]|nr:type I restriction enzyme HsdR N-terminal domain-containing protein [Tannerellaceae bacterium]